MRQSIQKILIPIDFTENAKNAVDYAFQFADIYKAEVTLIHVINPAHFANAAGHGIYMNVDTGQFEENAKKLLVEVAKKHQSNKIKINTKTGIGYVPEQVIAEAEKNEIDLIILGTHGTRGFEEFFLGSNAQRIISTATTPVLSIPPQAHKFELNKIVVLIGQSGVINKKINYAASIAKKFNTDISVFHASKENDTLTSNLNTVQSYFNNEGLQYEIATAKKDNITDEVLHYCKTNNADMVIVSGGNQSELSKKYIGLFPQLVVNHAKIPVLTVL